MKIRISNIANKMVVGRVGLVFIISIFSIFIVTALFYLFAGVNLRDAFSLAMSALTTFNFHDYPKEPWFLLTLRPFLFLIGLVLALVWGAVFVEWFISWSNKDKFGQGKIWIWPWTKKIIYLVNPVDEDKVLSIYQELMGKINDFILVVISGDDDDFEELSPGLAKFGIRYVEGCLKDLDTLQRAGMMTRKAWGAIICAPSYEDPDKADDSTSENLWIIQMNTSIEKIIVECVTPKNLDLFQVKDVKVVCFDTTTLNAVVKLLKTKFFGDEICLSYIPAFSEKSFWADDFQQEAWLDALKKYDIMEDDNGRQVQVVMPSFLDQPGMSDRACRRQVFRARCNTVGLYCSVHSKKLFKKHKNLVCADEVMALTLVKNLLED